MHFYSIIVTAALVSTSCFAETQHELKIGTFADNILSASSAQRAVDKMNSLVANSGHAECSGVTFKIVLGPQKYGPTIPKSVGGGNFNLFRNSGFSINVVSQVQECGNFVVTRGQSFAGCTSTGSFPVTLIPSNSELRPFLWLHELGHSQGLHDRCDDREDGCRSNIGWVMAGVLDKRNTKLGSDECRRLDGEQNFPILIEGDASIENSVEEILRQDWNHAMPLLAILALGESDKSRLREALSGGDTSLWANAVLALGLVGTEDDAFGVLKVVLEAPILSAGPEAEAGEIDFGVIDAKLNVPIALGYIANRTQSPDVIGQLGSLADPVSNVSLFDGFTDIEATSEYSAALARNVAVGLALSDMTATNPSNLQSRDLFESNFRGANRSVDLNMNEDFVEKLDALSREVSERGLNDVLLEDAAAANLVPE
jgi:hypothetical protein